MLTYCNLFNSFWYRKVKKVSKVGREKDGRIVTVGFKEKSLISLVVSTKV
jgi:hypothetical protein